MKFLNTLNVTINKTNGAQVKGILGGGGLYEGFYMRQEVPGTNLSVVKHVPAVGTIKSMYGIMKGKK